MRDLIVVALLLAALGVVAAPSAQSADCTLVVAADGATLAREGACAARHTPASTFKVPLALIGFDAGILVDPHAPRWDPPADAERVREPTDPAEWLALSVVWYSQHLVRDLGATRFAEAVAALGYGNADVSGDPGADNGMTRSWIGSSLEISPDEQVAFLRRMLAGGLPVSAEAVAKTVAAMPVFEADDWVVHGKTGTSWARGADGVPDREHARVWFVGWAERDGRTVVFARYSERADDGETPASVVLRGELLDALPGLVERGGG